MSKAKIVSFLEGLDVCQNFWSLLNFRMSRSKLFEMSVPDEVAGDGSISSFTVVSNFRRIFKTFKLCV